MGKRKRAPDLYRRGKQAFLRAPVFDDVTGEAVVDDAGAPVVEETEVWVMKLRPNDQHVVDTRANAARARVLAELRDLTSDQFLAFQQEAVDLSEDGSTELLVNVLVTAKVGNRLEEIQAEFAGAEDSEWAKDEYLAGLNDAWAGDPDNGDDGLKTVYALAESGDDTLDPDLVAEAHRVFDEMTRFNDLLQKRIDREVEKARAYYESESVETLRDLVVKQFCDDCATLAWVNALRRSRLLFAVREPDDHTKRHFDSYAEIEDLDDNIMGQLLQVYDDLAVSDLEGKGSPRPRSSSPDSGPPDTAETLDSSGLTGAAA